MRELIKLCYPTQPWGAGVERERAPRNKLRPKGKNICVIYPVCNFKLIIP